MKNAIKIILPLLIFVYTNITFAQATGNDIYNSNNRFQQNSSYRGSADRKYKSAQPNINHDYFVNQSANPSWFSGLTAANYNTSNSEIVVNVNILYNAVPSSYMAIFHINQAAEKISELDTLMNRRVEKFINMAKSLGLKRENFYLDMIALVPIYSKEKRVFSKTYTQVPKGFEIQKNIHVKYYDPNLLDKLFGMAAQCEIYDLIKVEYLYDSAEIAGQTMRNKAIQCLNTKLANYKKLGINVDTSFKQFTESGNIFFPIDRYQAYKPLAIRQTRRCGYHDENRCWYDNTHYCILQSGNHGRV
jgi:hypothetical protein